MAARAKQSGRPSPRAKHFYTIGYGGRRPSELVALLVEHGVRTVVDVRLRPDHAHLGSFARARSPEKGIQALLAASGLDYVSLPELGNGFMDCDDWRERFQALIGRAGDLLVERLLRVPPPFCLLCAEKRASDCHRALIADHLVTLAWRVEHIE
jgi:uncharacterized protein (DUF488 family)